MLGGFHTYGPGGYFNTALADVLPIEMDRLERQELDKPIREDMHLPGPLRMRPTPRSLRHFVLALAAGEKENAAAWARLPPLDGANQFARIKLGATILAEADGKEDKPLLVSQEFGSGRVIAFAGDSTWRWTMHGFESAHKRFWRQVVLWLARKDQVAQGNVWVRLDNTRFFPGNRVEFIAGAQSSQNEPIVDAEFKARIVKPDNKPVDALMIRRDEQMAGSFRETQLPGDYTIEVTATRRGELLGSANAVHRLATGSRIGQRLGGSRQHEGRCQGIGRRSHRARTAAQVACRVDEKDRLPGRETGNEENAVGPVAAVYYRRASLDGGVVLAEALGAGVNRKPRARRVGFVPCAV